MMRWSFRIGFSLVLLLAAYSAGLDWQVLALALAFGVLTGTGIVPTGAVGTELTAVTRRAFVPRVPVQIYKAIAIFSAALANAQTASGGVSSVTVPVQGSPFVQA